jgi:uncharacterized protein (DUF4213/DUF364 family)
MIDRAAAPDKKYSDGLLSDLCVGLAGAARRVLIGLNWTLVEGPVGTGLSHTPARGTAGCNSLPTPGNYAGRDLADLARLIHTDNVFERALGFASINAHHNRYDLIGTAENGLDLVGAECKGTVVVGRFPGLEARLPEAAVIEREPRLGEHPEAEVERLLPAATQVVITASALPNGSLSRLLPLARAAFVVVLGPSTPLCSRMLLHGIDALSGLVVVDPDAVSRVVAEGGAVQGLKRHSRYVTLKR